MSSPIKYVRCGMNRIKPVNITKHFMHPLHGHCRDKVQRSSYFLVKKYKFTPRNIKALNQIPVFIISYNHLLYVKQMVKWLQKYNFTNIHIIDNKSSYPPLLEYLKNCSCTVHYMDKNYGHKVLWQSGQFDHIIKNSMYIVSDPDIAPNDNLPKDFIVDMYRILGEYKNITKVGFALDIDNLPDTKVAKEAKNWEKKFWVHPLKDDKLQLYFAATDTTFALYRPGKIKMDYEFYHAIRIAGELTAKHLPWYIIPGQETTSDTYYVQKADKQIIHWHNTQQE